MQERAAALVAGPVFKGKQARRSSQAGGPLARRSVAL
jgi:hypothetical protein